MTLDNQIERLALGNLLAEAKAFYQDPNNMKAFEAWKGRSDENYRHIRFPGGVPPAHEPHASDDGRGDDRRA